MDFSKYPLDKLLHIIAAVIPGFIALWVYQVAVPGAFRWFWSFGSLGYRTKVALVLVVALLAGTTLNTLVNMLLGGIGGAIGGARNHAGTRPETAPWRDPAWRAALSKILPAPPKDTPFLFPRMYELRKQQVLDSVPPEGQRLVLLKLEAERLQSVREDMDWERWYQHYHLAVLRPSEADAVFYVQRGLQFNLETASLYVLASVAFVPGVRHWWCVAPAVFWAAALVATEWKGVVEALNHWSTLDRQITYLTELARAANKAAAAPAV